MKSIATVTFLNIRGDLTSALIPIHPTVTISYTKLHKPQYFVTVFPSFHYIPEGHRNLKMPPAMFKTQDLQKVSQD
jgi:hypothetical protein